MQNIIDNGFNSINADFEERKMSSFWNKIKLRQRRKINSSLSAQLLADHYANTMARGTAPLDTNKTLRKKLQIILHSACAILSINNFLLKILT